MKRANSVCLKPDHPSTRYLLTNALKKANPWIDVEIVVRQTAHQFGNPVEASIKLFKQMMPNICHSNLTGFELALEMELISATLNTRPFKRIVRETNTFTLSPKAMIYPIMSFQEVRNWLLHVGDQLNTAESWDGYDKLRSRNQSYLQHALKEF